jgi:glycosyltransferase involved in cell wall biosynthesis
MRIAIISTSRIPSKTANSIQVMKVCQAFCQLGHEIRLWLPGNHPQVGWDRLQSHYGIGETFPIFWLKSFRPFKRYDFAFRAVLAGQRWEADCYYIWPLQAAAIASLLNLPTILEIHDRPHGRFGPHLFRAFLKGRGARRLLPITEALAESLLVEFNACFEAPFALVSPMGVDLERFERIPAAKEARRLIGVRERFTAGYTGHLYPGRGIELLFQLAQRNPEVQFLWAGGEAAAVQYWREEAVAAKLGNIHVIGFVENKDLPLYQAACDVLLMPYEKKISTSSGGNTVEYASPMKVFEYMATGRLILSSDLPVLREILNPSNAILLSSEEIEAWDQMMKRILVDPDQWQPLADQAREDASKYSWKERARRSIEGL